jgi:hypothetical protein
MSFLTMSSYPQADSPSLAGDSVYSLEGLGPLSVTAAGSKFLPPLSTKSKQTVRGKEGRFGSGLGGEGVGGWAGAGTGAGAGAGQESVKEAGGLTYLSRSWSKSRLFPSGQFVPPFSPFAPFSPKSQGQGQAQGQAQGKGKGDKEGGGSLTVEAQGWALSRDERARVLTVWDTVFMKVRQDRVMACCCVLLLS